MKVHIKQVTQGVGTVGGTTNKIAKFTSTNYVGSSQIFDDGTFVGINTIVPNKKFEVNNGSVGFIRNATTFLAPAGAQAGAAVLVENRYSGAGGASGNYCYIVNTALTANQSAGASAQQNVAIWNGDASFALTGALRACNNSVQFNNATGLVSSAQGVASLFQNTSTMTPSLNFFHCFLAGMSGTQGAVGNTGVFSAYYMESQAGITNVISSDNRYGLRIEDEGNNWIQGRLGVGMNPGSSTVKMEVRTFVSGGGSAGPVLKLSNVSGFGQIFDIDPAHGADVTWVLPTTQGAANTVLQNNGSGVLSWATPSTGTVTGTGTTGTLTKWASSTSLTNSLLSETGSVVTSAGNLHVVGSTSDNSAFGFKVNSLAGTNWLSVRNDGAVDIFGGGGNNATLSVRQRAYANSIAFEVYGFNYENLFRITETGTSGSVTIGSYFTVNTYSKHVAVLGTLNVSAQAAGDVLSVTAGSGGYFVVSNETSNPFLYMQSSNITNVGIRALGTSYFNGGDVGIGLSSAISARMHVRGVDATTTNYAVKIENSVATSLFVVRNDGRVGIGVLSPSTALHVVGALTLNTGSTSKIYLDNAGSGKVFSLTDTTDTDTFTIALNVGSLTAISTNQAAFSFNKDIRFDKTGTMLLYCNNGGAGLTLNGSNSSNPDIFIKGTADATLGNVGINTSTPTARIHIKGVDTTSTAYAVKIENSATTSLFAVRNDGNVGIGILTPTVKMHQDQGNATATYYKFTAGTTTGTTATDGFNIGITSAGVAEIRQYENLAINIYTNNTVVANISATGFFNLGGSATAVERLEVDGSIALTRLAGGRTIYVKDVLGSGGGPLTLRAGNDTTTGGGVTGGELTLTGGNVSNATTASGTVGGGVVILGGAVSVGTGGTVRIVGGLGTTSSGNVQLAYSGSVRRGSVAIGHSTPADLLHLDAGNGTASYLRFTAGTTTGQTSADGLNIGINAVGNGEINLKENGNLLISTNNNLAIDISPTVVTMNRIFTTTGLRIATTSLSAASTLSEMVDIAYASLSSRSAPSFTTTLPTSPIDGQTYILRRIDADGTQTWTISAGGTILIYLLGTSTGVTTTTVAITQVLRLTYHSSFNPGWYQF